MKWRDSHRRHCSHIYPLGLASMSSKLITVSRARVTSSTKPIALPISRSRSRGVVAVEVVRWSLSPSRLPLPLGPSFRILRAHCRLLSPSHLATTLISPSSRCLPSPSLTSSSTDLIALFPHLPSLSPHLPSSYPCFPISRARLPISPTKRVVS